jgi:hypothetical protein
MEKTAPDERRDRLMAIYAFAEKRLYAGLAVSCYPRYLKRIG